MATAWRASTFPILARKWRSLQPSLGSYSMNFLMRNASKSSRRSQKKNKNSGLEGISKEHQRLLKTFPNPKGILHNTIISNVKDRSLHDLVQYKTEDVPGTKKGVPVQKKTILVISWPEEMELEGTGRKKREAELVAAAQACARLKELGLLDDNNNPLLPERVVYKKEEIRGFLRKQNQPDIINIDEDVNKELSRFLKNLQDQETRKAEDDDQTNEDLALYHMLMSEEEIPDRVMDIISEKPYQRLPRSKRDIRNGVLLQRLVNQKQNPAVTEIQKKVQTLPIMNMREEILSIINANQVVVLCGETGCGKTTQMPQFVLDDWIRQDMGSQCNIVVTQPRRISAIHTAERIALERGEQLGKTVGYQIRLHKRLPENHGCMLICTTGILLKKLQQNPDLTGISHVIVDEVHERDVNTDFLLVLLKNALERNKNVKLILMSASINPGLFSKYFDDCPMINVPGFMYPVKEYFLPEALADLGIDPNRHKSPLFEAESKNKGKEQSKKSKKNQKAPPTNVDLVVEVIQAIDKKKPPGAILCFLPGWQDIRSVYDKLQEGWGQSKRYEIYPVHSHVTVDNQQAMFDIPPEGVRKVVLATNVAETSITIGDVVYVVNTGNHKEERFDSDLGVSCLDLHWASQANIKQRKGRAGRRQPGECFHLFDQDVYNRMSKFQTAEILRIPLEQIVVQAKIHNETIPAEKFLAQAIEPPPSQAVSSAIDLLQDLAILNGKEELTSLGKKISCFGSDPRIAKAIIYSAIFRCVDPILTIAASLCIRDPFRENLENRKLIMEKMQEFSGDSESDHLMRVAVYQGWEEQKKAGGQSASSYVQSHQLYLPTLQFIRGLRRQFANNLEDSGMVVMSEDCFDSSARCNENSGDEELIKAVICSAFYPNLLKARLGKHEKGKLKTDKLIFKDLDSNNVLLHRKSVNCAKKDFRSKWLTYFSKVRSDVTFVRDCSVIHPMAVVAFAGNTLYMDKLTQKEKKDIKEADSSISPGHLVKLVIDDEQVPHETEDGSEFSPWEGLPITFYMNRETALYTTAFMRAMKQIIEECLTNEAAFLSGPVLERHSALLSLFRKLLGTPVLQSHSGPKEEQVQLKQ